MKTNLAVAPSEVFGMSDTAEFQVEMNAMLFSTLISGIYADKIQSPMREICTNAFDAHKMVGKDDVPFDLQMPSTLLPVFRVRDFGPSLSHDQIMGLYTTMFASSKRDTNNLVGGFGLGSKSPFAYTDAFTITRWRDGEKSVYAAYMHNGTPQISLAGQQESDEPTGLEVQFPVQVDDINRFRAAAERLILGFDVRPNIVNEALVIREPQLARAGSNWRTYDVAPISKLHVRQGCVLYPVDLSAMNSVYDSAFTSLQDSATVIDVPIGTLTVATSREALGYDETTVARLKELLAGVVAEIRASLAKMIDDEPDYLSACRAAHKLKRGTSRKLWTAFGGGVTWKGELLKDSFSTKQTMHYSVGRISAGASNMGFNTRATTEFSVTEDVVFLFIPRDVEDRIGRMRRLRHEIDGRKVCWIREIVFDPQTLASMKRELGRPEFINLADVEPLKLERTKRAPKPRVAKPTATYECRTVQSSGSYSAWAEEFFAPNGGIYVEASTDANTRLAQGKIISRLRRLGILDPGQPVYTFGKGLSSVPKRFPGWMTPWEAARAHLKEVFHPDDHARFLVHQPIMADPVYLLLRRIDVLPPRYASFLNEIEKIAETAAPSEIVMLFDDLHPDVLEKAKARVSRKLHKEFERLVARRPLLRSMARFTSLPDDQAAALSDYL